MFLLCGSHICKWILTSWVFIAFPGCWRRLWHRFWWPTPIRTTWWTSTWWWNFICGSARDWDTHHTRGLPTAEQIYKSTTGFRTLWRWHLFRCAAIHYSNWSLNYQTYFKTLLWEHCSKTNNTEPKIAYLWLAENSAIYLKYQCKNWNTNAKSWNFFYLIGRKNNESFAKPISYLPVTWLSHESAIQGCLEWSVKILSCSDALFIWFVNIVKKVMFARIFACILQY